MYQKLMATTTLGSLVGIGEVFDHGTEAKAGKYNVYKVLREEDDYECAIMFIHESEDQDVNIQLPQLDITDSFGVDGGTYGILTMKDENDTWYGSNRFEEWYEYNSSEATELTDGYVIGTNYGDGSFILYTNSDNSVFLLDDEEIYLSELLADCKTYERDDLSYFGIRPDIHIGYFVPAADGYEVIEKHAELPTEGRKVDALVDLIRSVAN